MKFLTLLGLLLVSVPVFQTHAADCTAINDGGRNTSADVPATTTDDTDGTSTGR